MSRPEVSLENYEAVYDFYETREPKPHLARAVHWIVSQAVKPDFHSAEGAYQEAEDHFSSDGRLIVAASHASMMDPFVLASMAQQIPELNPLLGSVFIPGKADLFSDKPFRIARMPVLDNFVAVPTFRQKDESRAMKQSGLTAEEVKNLRQKATERLLDLLTVKADEGFNVGIFPHGERNSSQKMRSGIGRFANNIADQEQFMIMPVGISYAEEKTKRQSLRDYIRDPFNIGQIAVYIGNPFPIGQTAEATNIQTELAINDCKEKAHEFLPIYSSPSVELAT